MISVHINRINHRMYKIYMQNVKKLQNKQKMLTTPQIHNLTNKTTLQTYKGALKNNIRIFWFYTSVVIKRINIMSSFPLKSFIQKGRIKRGKKRSHLTKATSDDSLRSYYCTGTHWLLLCSASIAAFTCVHMQAMFTPAGITAKIEINNL